MDRETLIYSPLVSSTGKADFRVRELQFGDGYSQRAPDGINTDLRTYSLEFRGRADYVQEVSNFFTRHKGVKAFKWKPQDRDNERLFTCKSMKTVFITPKVRSLAVEIREVLQ